MKELTIGMNVKGFEAAFASENSMKLEKIVPGYNNLQQLSWLREALRRAQGIGRVVTPSGLGTGWLISDDLVLTNNHVVGSKPKSGTCWIEFNYEVDWQGNPAPVERYEINDLAKTSKVLDYSILSVKGRPGEKYGFTDIRNAKRPLLTSSATHYPVIIQHPRGGFKQVALTDNLLVTMDETYAWYTTDTEPGSSGSPVFDQLWRPFALHHAGGPKRLEDGRVVILNEGIILSQVVADAVDILGFSEHVPNVVSDLISSGCFDLDAQAVDLDWYLSNPRLHNAIKYDTRGDNEIGPLIAAAAGVAAGAAAAHWAHVTSKEKVSPSRALTITLSPSYAVEILNAEDMSSDMLFEYLYNELRAEKAKPYLKDVGSDKPYFEVAALAAAFLAGVAAGAAAYKAGK